MDRKPEIPARGGRQLANFEPRIELRNISFRYPARTDALVLSDANLTVEPGTVVALVGPSGGGKMEGMGFRAVWLENETSSFCTSLEAAYVGVRALHWKRRGQGAFVHRKTVGATRTASGLRIVLWRHPLEDGK